MFKRGTGADVFDSHEAWNGSVHHVENRIILKLIRRQMWPATAELKQEWCWPLILFCHSCLADHHYHRQTSTDTLINTLNTTLRLNTWSTQTRPCLNGMSLLQLQNLIGFHCRNTCHSENGRWYSVWKSIFAKRLNTDLTKFHLPQPVFFSTLIEKFNF